MAQQNATPEWLEDHDKSGVVLSSVNIIIQVSSLPLQSELDGVLNSVLSNAPYADCFMLDTIKDSGPPAVDLTYSSVVEDFESLQIFGVLWNFRSSFWMLLCRVIKFPFFNSKHLLWRETTVLHVRKVILLWCHWFTSLALNRRTCS